MCSYSDKNLPSEASRTGVLSLILTRSFWLKSEPNLEPTGGQTHPVTGRSCGKTLNGFLSRCLVPPCHRTMLVPNRELLFLLQWLCGSPPCLTCAGSHKPAEPVRHLRASKQRKQSHKGAGVGSRWSLAFLSCGNTPVT